MLLFTAVGVTGFEPAASWSQTRRSSQTEPHPDVLQHHFYEVVVPCSLKNLFSLAQGKSYYIIWSTICQHLFSYFFIFFSKKDTIPENPLKMRVSGILATPVLGFFNYFFQNSHKNFCFFSMHKDHKYSISAIGSSPSSKSITT